MNFSISKAYIGLIASFAFILIIHAMVLIMGFDLWSFSLSAIITIFFVGFLYKDSFLNIDFNSSLNWKITILYFGILFLLLNFILFEPIHTWDARSIWFFHGKALFYDGGLVKHSIWTNEAYEFSHLDYPKLLPVLAASVANSFGYWNEYLPKLSLFILIIFPVAICFSCSRKWWVGLGLFVGIILVSRSYLWNGYMDSHLAFYSAISLLLIYRFKESQSTAFLLLVILSIGVLINLKNEGLPLAMFMFFTIIYKMPRITNYWKVTLVSLISFSGYFYWFYIKKSWGIENDLGLGFSSIPVIIGRILSTEIFELLKFYIIKAWAWLPITLILLIVIRFKDWAVRNVALIFVPIAYLALITAVYLGTPHALGWHLDSSVDRVFMPIHTMSIIITLLALEEHICANENASTFKAGELT